MTVLQAASPGKAYLQDQQALAAANMLAKRHFDDRLRAMHVLAQAAGGSDRDASPDRSPTKKAKRVAAGSVAAAAAAVAAASAARAAAAAAAGGSSGGGARHGGSRAHGTSRSSRRGAQKHGDKMRQALRASSSRVQSGSPSVAVGAYSAGSQQQGSESPGGYSTSSSPRKQGGSPASRHTPSNAAGGSYASPGSGWSAGASPGSVGNAVAKGGAFGGVAGQSALAQFWVSGCWLAMLSARGKESMS